MYHAVCREYIPNGLGFTDEETDEVSAQWHPCFPLPMLTLPLQYAAGWSPLHRVGLPIDVARVVAFLASQDGEWINGKVLGVDGGACM